MKLASGYQFFHDKGLTPGLGFVLIRVLRNVVKIQCVAEQISTDCGNTARLYLWDSVNMEKPYILGKMSLLPGRNGLRTEANFTLKDIGASVFGKYDCFALTDNSGKIILQTPSQAESVPATKEKGPFDPFNTTNPAYSWDRAESSEELKWKLTEEKISPSADIAREALEALNKYRHILLGKYKPGNKKYFIIGVPGGRPTAQENSVYRWINKVVSLEEYPFFEGYKLYYFDAETSAVVRAVLRTQPAGQQR